MCVRDSGSGVLPLIRPALGDAGDVDVVLDRVDGVLLSGSRTNVHPTLYGEAETESHGPFDHLRDHTPSRIHILEPTRPYLISNAVFRVTKKKSTTSFAT